MAKRCIYCKNEISDECVIDFCTRCGKGVWGERMFNAIVASMTVEKQKGNMELGRVSMNCDRIQAPMPVIRG